ncbi:hypothetical protein [Cellulomonas denverensis]|uniref:Uncharacterized protein n=1 Tax=Cellulomonas denverensis TaxID=264297 RepID=A0A7X6KU86_9CELL|nr:hypothetical protein [Cellulomonas denverensis]NKY22407.1 hypothetical protein [Cellulomonas denverensis]GIG27361.1 hypothetical protein Cde04nite_36050 [Cellulomonas denverensis]
MISRVRGLRDREEARPCVDRQGAISELHGVAQVNAVHARLGLGAKANGGFGAAGGQNLLRAVDVAPRVLEMSGAVLMHTVRAVAQAREQSVALERAERAHAQTRAELEKSWQWSAQQAEGLRLLADAGGALMTEIARTIPDSGGVRWDDLEETTRGCLVQALELAGVAQAVEALPIWPTEELRDATATDGELPAAEPEGHVAVHCAEERVVESWVEPVLQRARNLAARA